MEKTVIFLGIIFAAVYLASALIPSPTDCNIDELRPNPSNPHTFYSCTSYGPVLFQCPGELVFSVQQNKCDYTFDSDENQSSESEEDSESTTDNVTNISPIGSSEEDETSEEESSEEITTIPPTVKISSPTTSDLIPTSTVEQSTTKATSTSTKATETTTQKVTTTTSRSTPKPSNITTRKTTTTTTIRTTTHPPGIICEPGRVYYPDPTTCSKFYQCANGIPYSFPCPLGLNFNPNINVCDWPWNYPCPLLKRFASKN